MNTIAFIGLSHLGINYSLATAAKGFEVIACDPDQALVQNLSDGKFPVAEPGLEELFSENRRRIHYTVNPDELKLASLIFFSLDVKTDANNHSDLQPLCRLIESVASHITSGSTVVFLSQVTPGFTRRMVAQLRNEGRWQAGAVYYQVETLIFGRAVERALHPERLIVGCADPTPPFPEPYRRWLESFGCPILPMRYESAELAKISINFFLVSSVTTSNTLAELCEKIGADWLEIQSALRLDARIGPKAYLNPGLGLSGGNLERDLQTFRDMANELGVDWRLVEAWQANSRYRRDWVLRLLFHHLLTSLDSPRLAIWGLAYKENTNSTRNSAALVLIESIPHIEKQAYDPQVRLPDNTHPKFRQVSEPLAACREADALAIMTPWPQFKDVSIMEVRSAMRGRLILDPYGMLDETKARQEGFAYFKLGAGEQSTVNRPGCDD